MKAFIYKTNQYLLERYPTVWNTKLVWMLLSAIILHIVFFVFGYFTLSNPAILQERMVASIFFNNGTVFLTSIISILLLVVWLIYMFKNNAFKNFYPTTRAKLFGQFICYFLIIVSCTSFYLSYNFGIKTYITSTYSDAQINKEIEIANDAAMFLSTKASDYTIDKLRYPKPFFNLYCEQVDDFIDFEKPFIEFEDEYYQFYSLITKEVPLDERNQYIYEYGTIAGDSNYLKYVYNIMRDSTAVLYYKDSVVNVMPIIKTTKPSYYNASSTFFVSSNDTLVNKSYNYNTSKYAGYEDYDYGNRPKFSLRHQLRNQRNYELLERNDKGEIKKLLQDFINFSNYYKIEHNLTADKWFNLIYHPDNFEVKNFIRTQPKDKYNYNRVLSTEQTKFEKFFTDRLTDSYYKDSQLSNVFENIEDIKASTPFADSVHFFMWFAFIFSCFIFMFRVTGLKPLLFSVISVGVLALFISLMAALLFYVSQGAEATMYTVLYLILFIATLILAIPIFFINSVKKIIVAICVNISIIGFSLYIFLILGLINSHQEDACRAEKSYYLDKLECHTILDLFNEVHWSYIFFFIAIVFLFFYSSIIKKWKALPEG